MSTIALVGGAGFLGRELDIQLRAAGHSVRLIDRSAPQRGANAAHRGAQTDVSLDIITAPEAALIDALRGCDAVVHLAARLNPPTAKGRAAMRRLHIEGTERVFSAAVRAGVSTALLVSSAVVYGARAGCPGLRREDDAITPNADFPYAVDKAAQEAIAERFADALNLCVVRPAIIYGLGAKSFLTEIIRHAPVMPAVNNRRPLQDFVHKRDVADAIVHLLKTGARGIYNVPSAAPMSLGDVAASLGRRVVPVPRRLVAPFLDIGARVVPAHLRAPSYILDYLMFPFVMSGRKLIDAGYRPRITSREALLETMQRGVRGPARHPERG